MADYKYLDSLIKKVNKLRKQNVFTEFDVTNCSISYMPTKKISYVGFKQGYSDCLIKIQNKMKESEKLRAVTKDYLKYIRNEDGELIQIESYKKGRMDCLFQVCWIENVRYLFPYSGRGGYYPTYTYVTKYEGDSVVEEYMVDGEQIVYETYSQNDDGKILYNYVNYVSGGSFPVRESKKGVFFLNPLRYEESFSDNWLNHR